MNILKISTIVLAAVAISGCFTSTDADVASHNLSKAAEQFEVNRRVVFYNGITDTYILSIEGRCSVEFKAIASVVTCKTGESKFKKHYLRSSDNTTMFVEHLEPTAASVYHYKVIFKPQTIIPDVDLKTSAGSS